MHHTAPGQMSTFKQAGRRPRFGYIGTHRAPQQGAARTIFGLFKSAPKEAATA